VTRDQAQPGTQVTWTDRAGEHHQGTILATPADQSERVLVTWRASGQRWTLLLPIDQLRVVTEVGR
jgi:plastocyanin